MTITDIKKSISDRIWNANGKLTHNETDALLDEYALAVLDIVEKEMPMGVSWENSKPPKYPNARKIVEYVADRYRETIVSRLQALRAEIGDKAGHKCSEFNGFCKSGHTDGAKGARGKSEGT